MQRNMLELSAGLYLRLQDTKTTQDSQPLVDKEGQNAEGRVTGVTCSILGIQDGIQDALGLKHPFSRSGL